MKRNNLYYTLTAGVALMALLGLSSCYQFEMEKTDNNEEIQSRGDDGKVVWTFDTTESGAGKLDSLLTDREKKENLNRKAVTQLVVAGPVNVADLNIMAAFQYLDSLNIEGVTIIDNDGNKSEVFPVINDIQSTMGISLPKSVTEIAGDALKDGKYNYITIPENIQKINNEAFMNSKLISIEFPDNITALGSSVCNGCKSLKSAKLPQNLVAVPTYLFWNCTSLKSIEIPQRTTSIGAYAFQGCSDLSEVKFGDNVTSIGFQSFYNCTSLGETTLPTNLRLIDNSAFRNCTNLKTSLPANLKEIYSGAFASCKSITNIVFPKGIEKIETGAFSDIGITELNLPNDIPLSNSMFESCAMLKKATFADGITLIPNSFLRNCTSLEIVNIPESVTKIDDSAFRGCTSLQNIVLPQNLKTMGSDVFRNTGLKTLEIPQSLTSCGESILSECANFTALFWNSTSYVPNVSTDYSNYNMLIYIPEGTSSASGNENLVVNGHADLITLRGDSPFRCPRAFSASKVIYVRDFSNNAFGYSPQTGTGVAARWQSISLPFAPTAIIAKENGTFTKPLAPFDAVTEGQYPFWLRELTREGFKDVTAIEKDKPYIIAMPYNDNYMPEYNINTEVQFTAENVAFEVTPELIPSVGANYSLHPNYSPIKQRADYLTLTRTQRTLSNNVTYPAGGVFFSDRNIDSFEAYVTSNSGSTRSFIPLGSDAATRSSKKTVGKIPQKDDM